MTKRKPAEEKQQAGRNTLYRPEYCEQAKKLCLLSATDKEMADFFNVDVATLYRWKNEFPEFCDAINAGKIFADANVASRLYERAMGYSHGAVKIVANATTGQEHIVPYTEHYPPDTQAASLWLRNRQPDKWRDRQEITGKDGGALIVERVVYAKDNSSS